MTKKLPKQITLSEITSHIPIPWDSIIAELLSRPLKFPHKPTEGEVALILMRVRAWEIALHWVIKLEWNTKHKIPAPLSIVRGYKPKGAFLRNILRLCERCHTMQEALPPGAVPYPHAAYWFGLVFWDLMLNEIGSTFTLQEQEEQEREEQERIRQQIKLEQERNLDLELKKQKTFRKKETTLQERMVETMGLQVHYKNPLTEDSGMKATFCLFQAATALAQQSDVFRTGYWQPFLNSYKAETSAMSGKEWGRVTIENGKAYMQVGKGKHRSQIHAPEEWKK